MRNEGKTRSAGLFAWEAQIDEATIALADASDGGDFFDAPADDLVRTRHVLVKAVCAGPFTRINPPLLVVYARTL